ncbi:hypothetical protein N7532_008488 [Penicillium argentinense]|uniref:Zn(2)-C6 fungal-type domain-containing protein n=1 Tax=Penicillium argentinense TaxID=1131581 RepID=A0A9W9K1N3_9EURO|nr:uncharacterized protein N7532_008488 [Penicillium argentinense]KAJ5089804.1 hypothetical protein N7532_008488 [Penicillium argentinense]
MAATSVAQIATQKSGPGMLDALDAVETHAPVRKRKASNPPSNKTGAARQKITRACDSCKVKKTRCTGTLPCTRCTRLSLSCRYNAAYSRGLPPVPRPATLSPDHPVRRHVPEVETARLSSDSLPRDILGHATAGDTVSSQPVLPGQRHPVSVHNSPEPGSTDFDGNYLGPASGVSFINRVWSRLHQDETQIPNELENESSKNTAVFMFGDKPYSQHQDVDFTLPPFEQAMELIAIYFDFSMVTYRFLHRGSVENWVKQIYENQVSISNLPVGNMMARTAIVLMIFAVSTVHNAPGSQGDGQNTSECWFAASKYISSLESGAPRLETIQARLIQCLYLLSSSRANECWYSFGTALQVVTALGLHRKCPVRPSKKGCSYLELELRKRIFWSVYVLDKYLSIMFGRPRLLHDEDIDQELPDEMNDEDLLEEDPSQRTGSTDSMMIASVLHYRLGRILGEISRQLYSINPLSRDSPLETAVRLTSELEKWKESVPPLFNSVRPSSLIPPLCRQSQVLQLAYSHAMIHVTRSFLLDDFTDLSRRPRDPHPLVSAHVHKCIEAAEHVMTLVDGLAQQTLFIQSFWFTHYVCFCAILVVYIHIIQQHRQSLAPSPSAGSPADVDKLQSLFLLAETCQQHLAEATRKNCPSRRYSIILEELRREVHRQLGSNDQSSQRRNILRHRKQSPRQDVVSPVGADRDFSFSAPDLNFARLSGMLQTPELGASVEDIGLLDNLGGSIWWAQLDSWALSSFPNDPTTFNF